MSAPTRRIVDERWQDSHGPLIADMAAAFGLVPDAWQSDVLADIARIRDDKTWAHDKIGLSVPRQNGKNAILEMYELYLLVELDADIIHTAHEVRTAKAHFARLVALFEDHPSLAARVKTVRHANGQERISLKPKYAGHSPGSLVMVARTKSSGRGLTADILVCDEAQEMAQEDTEALFATVTAGKLRNPQIILTGTPPGPAAQGATFRRLRDIALEGTDDGDDGDGGDGLAWLEWSVNAKADYRDPDNWAATNPAYGTRVSERTVRRELTTWSEASFRRERLGQWEHAAAERVVSASAWTSCQDAESVPSSDIAFGLDMNPERSRVAIAAASRRPDNRIHIEVIRSLDITTQGLDYGAIVAMMTALNRKYRPRAIVLDERSPADALASDLERAKLPLRKTWSKDLASACGQFVDLVGAKQLAHIGQPGLDEAVAVAAKRAIGSSGAWAWHRTSATADITPLVAVSIAIWGLTTTRITEPTRGTGKVVIL